jgi:hypothetical protein
MLQNEMDINVERMQTHKIPNLIQKNQMEQKIKDDCLNRLLCNSSWNECPNGTIP